MPVRAGRLTERVTVQREGADIYDSRGQVETAPDTVATVWARVNPLSGEEAVTARKIEANTTHEVTIRYSSDVAHITPEWWLLWSGRRLDINQALNPENRNEELVLLCAEKTS